jgi:hypothetical protein
MRRVGSILAVGLCAVFVVGLFGQGAEAQTPSSSPASPTPIILAPLPTFRTSASPTAALPSTASPSSSPSPSAAPSPSTQQLCLSVTGVAPIGGWTIETLLQALFTGTATISQLDPATNCAPIASPTPASPTLAPLPTATLAPLPTPTRPPLPTLAPLPTATPAPTPHPTATPNSSVQQPGTIWFGTSLSGGVLRGHRSSFRPGQKVAVSALFSRPPNATRVTMTLFTGAADRIVFSQSLTIGVQWQGLGVTIIRPLSAGRYHLQISHGGTLLADGRFTVR